MTLRERWRRLIRRDKGQTTPSRGEETHLLRAANSLRALLEDASIPPSLRASLASDYSRIEVMLDKLEHGHLHIAVFGRVSVGKSALLNALLGETAFQVGVLHGTTIGADHRAWQEANAQGVQLIDTPGINELSGEERENLAFDVAGRSDLVMYVVDGDMTSVEVDALQLLARTQRPMLLVLNKADRYTTTQREELLARLREHSRCIVAPENVVAVMAQPGPQRVLKVLPDGREVEEERHRDMDVSALRERIFAILESEGKTLAALNAALFAGDLSDEIGQRLTSIRQDLAARTIRMYCLGKGIAVALNPVPVADLLAAATLDIALVMHLSRIYGLPLTRTEAGRLLTTISVQLVALLSVVWGVNLVSSALKIASVGLSTALTAAAQGALAWYATVLVGKATERYLAQGKSWGELGPKRIVADIIANLDRDSILREAREEILGRLKNRPPA